MDLTTDDNNNMSSEKSYSLRPRLSGKTEKEEDDEELWKPRGRSRKRQIQKSAPLSKYRRKTANARERSRMREINIAFETLRRAVPHLSNYEINNEKISKIMTLRLAMKYITALSSALEDPESYSLDFQTSLSLMDNCSTTSSTSDHKTEVDHVFSPTIQQQSIPTAETLLSSSTRKYNSSSKASFQAGHTSSLNLLPPTSFSQFFNKQLDTRASKVQTELDSNKSFESRVPELNRFTLTPPDDSSLPDTSFLIGATFQLQSTLTSFTTEFDGLPSPVMDFSDFL